MSAKEVKGQIVRVQESMTDSYSTTFEMITSQTEITPKFLKGVSVLLEKFGQFVGEAKAKHSDYLEEISNMEERIREYFEYLTKSSNSKYCFKLVNLGIGKMSELLSFVEGLEASPPKKRFQE